MKQITGKDAFYLFETYGLPIDVIIDELVERKIEFDKEKLISEFEASMEEHREKSRTGAEEKFTGGLADKSTEVTRLHTTHHLLLKALQTVLGDHVKQRGSNITAERLRIDFSHPTKMTPEEKLEVEQLVNEKLEEKLHVVRRKMKLEDAEKLGAEMEFGQKYPDVVSVYFIEDEKGNVLSKEFCGGPHVKSTGEILESGKFKIKKEESSSAGIRRIKGILKK